MNSRVDWTNWTGVVSEVPVDKCWRAAVGSKNNWKLFAAEILMDNKSLLIAGVQQRGDIFFLLKSIS